ncbi:hypothetical protein [Microvirga sp. M2]|uniref:hypothetical protein n=1 Tax=Microvirga sp. M2 TaxID=3073270 RepID=UPI0039C2DA06
MRDSTPSTSSPDVSPALRQLERTIVASIALMKRMRRERRRSLRPDAAAQSAKP